MRALLVRLTVEHRFAGTWLPPGSLLAIPDGEAAELVFDGVAVPVTRDAVEYGRETRAGG